MEYLEVGKISEVNNGTMKAYKIKDIDMLVANYNENYYAIGRKCTHMGGDLWKGKLEGKIVIAELALLQKKQIGFAAAGFVLGIVILLLSWIMSALS